jgi:hypothetical protein
VTNRWKDKIFGEQPTRDDDTSFDWPETERQ